MKSPTASPVGRGIDSVVDALPLLGFVIWLFDDPNAIAADATGAIVAIASSAATKAARNRLVDCRIRNLRSPRPPAISSRVRRFRHSLPVCPGDQLQAHGSPPRPGSCRFVEPTATDTAGESPRLVNWLEMIRSA